MEEEEDYCLGGGLAPPGGFEPTTVCLEGSCSFL